MIRIIFILIRFIVFFLNGCKLDQKDVFAGNIYNYSWESVKDHPVPEWFNDARLGIFYSRGPTEFRGPAIEYISEPG